MTCSIATAATTPRRASALRRTAYQSSSSGSRWPCAKRCRRSASSRCSCSKGTFAARDLQVTESRQLGAEGQHWRTRLRAWDSVPVEAMFFDHGQLAPQFPVGSRLDCAFRLKRTRWDGYWRLEMELLDVVASQRS